MQKKLLTVQDLAAIVERASMVEERLGDAFVPSGSLSDGSVSGQIASRINSWRRTAAALSDEEEFLNRLSFDGLNVERVQAALGPVRLKEEVSLPEWAFVLAETWKLCPKAAADFTADDVMPERFIDNKAPLPFEDILAPFVLTARYRLTSLSREAYGLLDEKAHAVLERSLLKRLIWLAARTLYVDFSLLRSQLIPPSMLRLEQLLDPKGQSIYKRFTGDMLTGGLAGFFLEYPVLARLLSSAVSVWAKVNAEFLLRLASDRTKLRQIFREGKELGEVGQIQLLTDDLLRGERVILAVTFTCGLKLVYKPRNLGIEESFYTLLSWINNKNIGNSALLCRELKLLNQSSHGWVEYVEHQPCRSQNEARHYYTRTGMLLALIYLLKGIDIHFENVIACGEHPLMIDLETLMQPRTVPGVQGIQGFQGVTDAQYIYFEQIMDSVLYSGLLPRRTASEKDRENPDYVSGLGGEGLSVVQSDQDMIHINTNYMMPGPGDTIKRQSHNIPVLEGTRLRLEDYSAEIIAGFEHMYRFLEIHRNSLLAPDSPLTLMAACQVRYIYRSAREYTALFGKLRDPIFLRDGADYSIGLEHLTRRHLVPKPLESVPDGTVPRLWPLLAAEKSALQQGIFPFFTASAGSVDLEVSPGRVIKQCLAEPGFARAIACLKGLNDQDLKQQIGHIKSALRTE